MDMPLAADWPHFDLVLPTTGVTSASFARAPGMARLFILNRYFAPDESATSRMASSLAFSLAERGWDVHAVACRQLYGLPSAGLPAQAETRNVTIHRIWTSAFGRRYLLGRAIDYLTFYLSAFLWLLRHTRRGDVLIVATDPPLLSTMASVVAAVTGAAQLNWMHDIYPEVATALGISAPGPFLALLQWLRDRSLIGARMNVAIGHRMAAYLRGRGVPSDRISVIHNWSDGHAIHPLSPEANPLRASWGLVGKFVVGYSGNLGRGHEFDTIVRAAIALRHRPDIVFVFIGGGHHLPWIQSQVATHELTNVMFKPYQAAADLSQSLGLPDLHLVTLQPSLEGLMVPCKFYGVAAAGRPTVFVGDVTGEIPTILRDADCGSAIPIGDVDGLIECILRLRDSSAQVERWSSNARAVFVQRFDRRHAIDSWCSVLLEVASGRDIAFGQVAEAD
jgi:glycosyltransferase involved in cell wall biosynthesis